MASLISSDESTGRILNGDHGLRIAVLINDFGSINIDADLVRRDRSGTVDEEIRRDLSAEDESDVLSGRNDVFAKAGPYSLREAHFRFDQSVAGND